MKNLKISIIKVGMSVALAITLLSSCKKDGNEVLEQDLKINKMASVPNGEANLPGDGGISGPEEWAWNDDRWVSSPKYSNAGSLERMFSPYLGVHTIASAAESKNLLLQRYTESGGAKFSVWFHEGTLGWVKSSKEGGTVPLYRYFRGKNNDHYFSLSASVPPGYLSEGVQGYVYTSALMPERVPVYVYSTQSGDADHVYSINFSELGNGNSHWRYEGIGFYILR